MDFDKFFEKFDKFFDKFGFSYQISSEFDKVLIKFMTLEYAIKSGSRRILSLKKRDIYALNALERLKLKIYVSYIQKLRKIIAQYNL